MEVSGIKKVPLFKHIRCSVPRNKLFNASLASRSGSTLKLFRRGTLTLKVFIVSQILKIQKQLENDMSVFFK